MTTTPPASPGTSGNALLQEILGIVAIGATAAAGFSPVGGAVAGIEALIAAVAKIGQKAASAYQAQVGKPLDLSLIPEEAPIATNTGVALPPKPSGA